MQALLLDALGKGYAILINSRIDIGGHQSAASFPENSAEERRTYCRPVEENPKLYQLNSGYYHASENPQDCGYF